MTDDLVKRLREDAIDHRDVAGCCDCDPKDTRNWRHALNVEEAADRIEQLEAALDDVATHLPRAEWHYLKDETLITLGEKKDD